MKKGELNLSEGVGGVLNIISYVASMGGNVRSSQVSA